MPQDDSSGSPKLPVIKDCVTEESTTDLVKISKMLTERDRQRHLQRMDFLTLFCALVMALVCVGAAIYFGTIGNGVLVAAFLGAPIGLALINGLVGRLKKRDRKTGR